MALVSPSPNEESLHSDSSLSPELMEEWQKNKPKYGRDQFLKHVLNTGTCADVTFLAKREDGQVEKIRAHKCILKFKSEFFTVLFSDRWENDEVDLTTANIICCDFKAFLEFLYLRQVKLTSENVMALYYMSNLYQIVELQVKCEIFFTDIMDEENVLTIFKVVFLHDTRKSSFIFRHLSDFICRKMLENTEMFNLSESQLALICANGFNSDRLKLTSFCLRWAVKKFDKIKLKQFRELDYFFQYKLNLYQRQPCTCTWCEPEPSSEPRLKDLVIWDEDEEWGILMKEKMNSVPVDPDAVYAIKRFESRSGNPWTYRLGRRTDRVSLRCTESILLTGIGLYGDFSLGKGEASVRPVFGKRPRVEIDLEPEPATYSVELRVHIHGRSDKELLKVYRRRVGSDMNMTSGIYNFNLNKPLYLMSDEWYTISVRIIGGPSFSGQKGTKAKLMRCGNTPVLFEFQEASLKDEESKLSNPTGVPIGQIPELYFKLASGVDDEDDIVVLD